jgi:hypothetical protein
MRIFLKTSAVNGWPVSYPAFYERGWGAAADFPGIVLHPMDRASKAICLSLITFTLANAG